MSKKTLLIFLLGLILGGCSPNLGENEALRQLNGGNSSKAGQIRLTGTIPLARIAGSEQVDTFAGIALFPDHEALVVWRQIAGQTVLGARRDFFSRHYGSYAWNPRMRLWVPETGARPPPYLIQKLIAGQIGHGIYLGVLFLSDSLAVEPQVAKTELISAPEGLIKTNIKQDFWILRIFPDGQLAIDFRLSDYLRLTTVSAFKIGDASINDVNSLACGFRLAIGDCRNGQNPGNAGYSCENPLDICYTNSWQIPGNPGSP